MGQPEMAEEGAPGQFASSGLQVITPEALRAWMAQDPAPVILDVRREEGYVTQPLQIPGALRFSLEARPPVVPSLPRATPLVTYCT